jgi:hypothetical protein
MTATSADHRVSISTSISSSPTSSSASSSTFPVSVVSIISLSVVALLSALTLSSLVLTGPAGSLVSGGAGLTSIDASETLGG